MPLNKKPVLVVLTLQNEGDDAVVSVLHEYKVDGGARAGHPF